MPYHSDLPEPWKKNSDAIAKRWPAWGRLQEFQAFANGLPEADACGKSMAAAITEDRSLLANPDPVPELTKQLTTALRIALGKQQDELTAAFQTGDEKLAALRTRTLTDRKNLLDAVPQRFARAVDETNRLLEPKAVRIMLPGATIHDLPDLEQWLATVREQVEAQLKEGPVIL